MIKITAAVGVSAISSAVILNNHIGRNVLEKRQYFNYLHFQMQDTFLLTAEGEHSNVKYLVRLGNQT